MDPAKIGVWNLSDIEAVTPRATVLGMTPTDYLRWRKLLREDYARIGARQRTTHSILAATGEL